MDAGRKKKWRRLQGKRNRSEGYMGGEREGRGKIIGEVEARRRGLQGEGGGGVAAGQETQGDNAGHNGDQRIYR